MKAVSRRSIQVLLILFVSVLLVSGCSPTMKGAVRDDSSITGVADD